jgi:hypothetical protein
MLFTVELAERCAKSGLSINCLDPGTVNTKMLYAGWGSCGMSIQVLPPASFALPLYVRPSPSIKSAFAPTPRPRSVPLCVLLTFCPLIGCPPGGVPGGTGEGTPCPCLLFIPFVVVCLAGLQPPLPRSAFMVARSPKREEDTETHENTHRERKGRKDRWRERGGETCGENEREGEAKEGEKRRRG